MFLVAPLSGNPQAPTKDEPATKSSPGGTSARARTAATNDFPDGTANLSDLCGACHQAIYREFAEGFAPIYSMGKSSTKRPRASRFGRYAGIVTSAWRVLACVRFDTLRSGLCCEEPAFGNNLYR